MATKFYNQDARFFNELVLGASPKETILDKYIKRVLETEYSCSEEKANEYRNKDIQGLNDVLNFFNSIKFYDIPLVYSLNTWGYGQINLDNMTVIGENKGVIVCLVNNYSVYTISKAKFNKKECAYLDSERVLSTSWKSPYSTDKMQENSFYNAYYGH